MHRYKQRDTQKTLPSNNVLLLRLFTRPQGLCKNFYKVLNANLKILPCVYAQGIADTRRLTSKGQNVYFPVLQLTAFLHITQIVFSTCPKRCTLGSVGACRIACTNLRTLLGNAPPVHSSGMSNYTLTHTTEGSHAYVCINDTFMSTAVSACSSLVDVDSKGVHWGRLEKQLYLLG